jgi:ribonuclease R
VTRAGLFVRLNETGADGFIPAKSIGSDYFRYHEAAHALIGDASGESFRLGDAVTVRLVEAVPVAGALRFELLSEGRAEVGRKRLKRTAPRSSRSKRAGGRPRAAGRRPGK